MTVILYLLIAALVFMVMGYLLAKVGCTPGERYMSQTPTDPVTEDSGNCEDSKVLALEKKRKEEAEAETQRIQEEAAKVKAEKEAAEKEALRRKADEEAAAEKEAAEKVAVQAEAENKQKAEEENISTKNDSMTEEEVATDASVPEGLLDAPRNGKKDNLTRIKGIGVKIDQALNSIGVWHFDQIAAWTEENMAWADRELAFPGRAKRDNWVGQAKLLAEGKETEFSKRVDKGEVASSKKV